MVLWSCVPFFIILKQAECSAHCLVGIMGDVVDCEKVFETLGSFAVFVVEEYSEVELISTQWMHCVNPSNHSLMPSLSYVPFVIFPDKVLGKVHILDLGLWIGCIVGKEGCEFCGLGFLLGNLGFLVLRQKRY